MTHNLFGKCGRSIYVRASRRVCLVLLKYLTYYFYVCFQFFGKDAINSFWVSLLSRREHCMSNGTNPSNSFSDRYVVDTDSIIRALQLCADEHSWLRRCD